MNPTYSDDSKKLNSKAKDLARARRSLIEELEATNFYEERIQASSDKSLRKLLAHNRDEEKEHSAMLVKWLRKNDKVFDRMFTEHD